MACLCKARNNQGHRRRYWRVVQHRCRLRPLLAAVLADGEISWSHWPAEPTADSGVICVACHADWRTSARYADELDRPSEIEWQNWVRRRRTPPIGWIGRPDDVLDVELDYAPPDGKSAAAGK